MDVATQPSTTITATLWRTWDLPDGSVTDKPDAIGVRHATRVPTGPGTFELERVANPRGHEAPWLVLKGTLVGMTEGAWKNWPVADGVEPGSDEFHIVITETEV